MSALEIQQKPTGSFLEFDTVDSKFKEEEIPDILPVLNPVSYVEKHYQAELNSVRIPINTCLHKKPVGKPQFVAMCVLNKEVLMFPFLQAYLKNQYESQGWNVSIMPIEKQDCFVLRFPQSK